MRTSSLRGALARRLQCLTAAHRLERHPAAGAARREIHCLICDEHVADAAWTEHMSESSHRARHAVCSASVNPDKHEALMRQLWEHVQLDFALVDEVNQQKVRRRQARLRSTLEHLVQEGAIREALLTLKAPTGTRTAADGSSSSTFAAAAAAASSEGPSGPIEAEVSNRLDRHVIVGEREMRYHIVDRVTRLYPAMLAGDVRAIVLHVCAQDNLADLFDSVGVAVVERSAPQAAAGGTGDGTAEQRQPATARTAAPESLLQEAELPTDVRAAAMLGIIGELQCFSLRERAHYVTDNRAAKEIVLTVLATHAMENIISELVHNVLQRIVDEGTPVWTDYIHSLRDAAAGSAPRPPPMPGVKPTQEPVAVRDHAQGDLAKKRDEDLLVHLTETASHHRAPRSMLRGAAPPLAPSYSEFVRASSLDITVRNPVNKSAFFAQTSPKITTKAKK